MKNYIKVWMRWMVLSTTLFLPSFSSAQVFQWALGVGGAGAEIIHDVKTDAAGNIYATGYFSQTVDFDHGTGVFALTSTGGIDIFLAKYSPTGNFIWVKKIGGTSSDVGTSIAIDTSSNIYLTGSFSTTADFNPGLGTFNITSSGLGDIFYAKYDSSGTFIWAKRIGSTAGDEGEKIIIHNDQLFLTGYFTNTVDFNPSVGTNTLTSAGSYDIFLAKYDADGNYSWAIGIGNTGIDKSLDMVFDTIGKITITGIYSNTVDFDPSAGFANWTSSGGQDNFLAQFDTLANLNWAVAFGGSNVEQAYSVDKDNWGNIYMTGSFRSTVDFDPGVGSTVISTGSTNEIYISKFDALGNFIWVKTMGGNGDDAGNCVLTLGDKILLCGSFSDTADFDPTPADSLFISAGASDIFIEQLDSSGTMEWLVQTGSIGFDQAETMTLQSSSLYVGGTFENTVDFNPGIPMVNYSSLGSMDLFIEKFNLCAPPLPPQIYSGNDTLCAGMLDTFLVHPVAGAMQYLWTTPPSWSGTSTDTMLVVTTSAASGLVKVSSVNFCTTSAPDSMYVYIIPSTQITSAPSSTYICNIGTELITANAIGTNLTYQWSNNFVPLTDGPEITGSTDDSLTFTPFGFNDTSGLYQVIVSGTCGIDTSQNFFLHFGDSAQITGAPVSQILCAGENAMFVVSAPGEALTYQWKKGNLSLTNGSNISGATNDTLLISNVSLADSSSQYYVEVNGPCGGADSSAYVALTVQSLPQINIQPQNQISCSDTMNIQFSVAATGTGLLYQWKKGNVNLTDGGNIIGSNTSVLNINNATISDTSSSYHVIVSGSCLPPDTSTFVSLEFHHAPQIVSQPNNVTVCKGSAASFTANVTGNMLTYQWKKGNSNLSNGGNISGAHNPTLIINPVQFSDSSDLYHVVITGSCTPADTSVNVFLHVNSSTAQVTLTGGVLTSTNNGAFYQWIDCDTHLPVPGANGQSFTGSGFHTYALVLTQNGCKDTSDCFYLDGTGISPAENGNSISVYPNPNRGKFVVQSEYGIIRNEIFNTLGEKIAVYENNYSRRCEIEITDFKAGVYFVSCTTDREVFHLKIVKE